MGASNSNKKLQIPREESFRARDVVRGISFAYHASGHLIASVARKEVGTSSSLSPA